MPPYQIIRLNGLSIDDLLDKKLSIISQCIIISSRYPEIRQLAYHIVRKTKPRDKLAEAYALYDWVKKNIQYRNDPLTSDTFSFASHTLNLKAGDCDDHTILLSALFIAVGLQPRLIVVATQKDLRPKHIYPQVKVYGRWLTADTTNRYGRFGVALPLNLVTKRWIYKVL